MLHNTFCRRLAALVLTLAVALSAVLPVFAVYPMPVQTATETEAVYLFNADTGKTILSQNADQQKYVASLTKLMTALLLVESGKDLNGEVTVPTDLTQEFKDIQNANGTTMGLRIGETVRRIDLLNAMLIVSANDAASVIAWDVGDSVVGFVQQMNAKAAELGCTGTNFTCAHGLFDYGNVSTAQDLAKIAAACAENQTFAQVAGTASYVLPATNLRKAEYTISSSNSLMNSESANYREYVKWVKGGFTTLAGRCIVAFSQQDGHNYGLVILGCDTLDHLFAACDDLFDWAFASFADRPLVDTQTVLTTVDLTKCRTEPAVELYAAAPVSGYGHSDEKVSYSFDLPESVSATVKEGQKLGTATVYLDGYEVGQVDLVTHREYVSDFRTDIKATLLLLCALILILCALGFAGLFKKVTGLDVKDFELLVSLGVFNDSLMNDAVYKFKRYEDASLSYTGIDRHEGENRGGWDTVISDADYNSMFALQQASMEAPIPSADDLPEKPFLDFAEAVRDMEQPQKGKQYSQKVAENTVVHEQHLEKPRYTPPAPKSAEPAPQKQMDLSCVVVGSQLRHKAFGMGTVKEIQGSLIVVVFGGTEKKVQFPGALLQGFLSLPE